MLLFLPVSPAHVLCKQTDRQTDAHGDVDRFNRWLDSYIASDIDRRISR